MDDLDHARKLLRVVLVLTVFQLLLLVTAGALTCERLHVAQPDPLETWMSSGAPRDGRAR